MTGTKVEVIEFKDELDSFLEKHDVLSVQHSHTVEDLEWGKR